MKLKEYIKEFLNKWFGKGPDGKTNPHQLTLLTAIIGFPVAVLLHLQMGYEMGTNPRVPPLQNLMSALAHLPEVKRLVQKSSYYTWDYNFSYSWLIFFIYIGIVFAMYKAARDVHTNGIHNTFTSKGRGKMNHIKQFFREKGLYLFCLAMVFAATAAGILALRTVVSNVADLTRTRKEALQNDSAWTQPDTAIDKPAQDVPKPTTTPAATEKPSATPAPAAAQAPKATAAPPAQTVTKPGIWDAKPLAAFSGNELVYSATLGDWRTHNGADYAAPAGESVTAAMAGKVVSVSEDALWGVVVEVEDANGVTWRYCGVAAPAVKAGDSVTAAAALGTAGSIPAETSGDAHIHLECVKDGAYLDPEGLM